MDHPFRSGSSRPKGRPDHRPRLTTTFAGPVQRMHMMHPQNVMNSSAGRGPMVNLTFSTPPSSSGQDSEAVMPEPVETARADHEIYYHQLLTKKRGSPLWVPGPGMQHPIEYRQEGIRIGDVGIITSTGDFDFLFNIFLPADHPANNRVVPQGFFPLPHEQLDRDIQKTCVYGQNSYVASSPVRKSAVPSNDIETPLADHIFEHSSGEAAILTMPDGASTQDLRNTRRIRQCISKNAQRWYKYVTEVRGRTINNGDIRVVIGIDKVRSWGIATSTCNIGQTACLMFRSDRNLSRIRYYWDCTGGSGRAGPEEIEINDLMLNNATPQNQCVFVRTMNFTLSGDIWDDFSSQIVAQPVGPMSGQGNWVSADRERLARGRTSRDPGTSSSHRQTNSMQGTSYPITSITFDSVQHGIDYHPSTALHAHLHEKFPSASIVITQDSDWISVLNDDDLHFPQPEEVVARILKSSNASEKDGIVSISKKPDYPGGKDLRAASPHQDSTQVDKLTEKLDAAEKRIDEYSKLIASLFAELQRYQDTICLKCRGNVARASLATGSPPISTPFTLPVSQPIAGVPLITASVQTATEPSFPGSSSSGAAHDLSSESDSSGSSPKVVVEKTTEVAHTQPSPDPDWSVEYNPEIRKTLDIHVADTFTFPDQVFCTRYSRDGKYLAVGLANGAVYIHNMMMESNEICVLVEQPATVYYTDSVPPPSIVTVQFSLDNKYLATGGSNGQINIWEIDRSRLRAIFKHNSVVRCIDFSPNNHFLVSATFDDSVCLWRIRDGSRRTIYQHDSYYSDFISVAFSPNGRYVAAGNDDDFIRIWDVRTSRLLANCHIDGGAVYLRALAFTRNGEGIVVGGNTVQVWDISSLKDIESGRDIITDDSTIPIKRIFESKDLFNTTAFSFSSDNRWVLSGSFDSNVYIWDAETSYWVCTLKGHQRRIWGADFSPAGHYIVSGSDDCRVMLWRYEMVG